MGIGNCGVASRRVVFDHPLRPIAFLADEVIDAFLPVFYFAVQKATWRKLARSHPHHASTMVEGHVPVSLG